MRHYHAALIHASGMSLFAAVDHVTRGQSKISFLLGTVRWLQSLRLVLKWVLLDREYYRYAVLAGLKGAGVSVITPAKQCAQLRAAKVDYLLGRKGRVQAYRVGTKNKKGVKTQYTPCWVVLYPHGTQSLSTLRGSFRRGMMSLDEVAGQLYGLVTTAAPQGHGRKFPQLLRRLYHMRWQVETGFREVDLHRSPWRSDRDETRLLDEVGRMVVHDLW